MSHSAKWRGILDLCRVGHDELEYLRVLNARCCCSRFRNRKSCLLQLRTLVAPALNSTLLGKLALASLFALSQSPKRVLETRAGIPYSNSKATQTETVHVLRTHIQTTCRVCSTIASVDGKETLRTQRYVVPEICRNSPALDNKRASRRTIATTPTHLCRR